MFNPPATVAHGEWLVFEVVVGCRPTRVGVAGVV